MKRFGLNLMAAGLMVFSVQPASRAQTNQAPDFKEVYDLIRAHVPGITDEELDHAAVHGLLKELGAKASLVANSAANKPAESDLVSQPDIFEKNITYLRIARVEDGLANEVGRACKESSATNKLNGLVLDLRYADGTDYAAAAATADLFISKSQPLLNLGNGRVSSHEKTDAIKVPVAVLVNRETAGAAEALAAIFREANAGLILGGRTAGQAMVTEDFPLRNGGRLRIATAQVMLGDGSALPAQGIKPDIDVAVSAADERAYYADAFRVIPKTIPQMRVAGSRLSLTNQPEDTNGMLHRMNEAELVRERNEGLGSNEAVASARVPEPEAPVVSDPALARALDLLKGLAVVRQARP